MFFALLMGVLAVLAGVGRDQKPMKTDTENEVKFTSDDALVRVVQTTKPRRFPQHDFPVILIRLKAQRGSRVQQIQDEGVEWMPRYSEVGAICRAFGIKVPEQLQDKPAARRLYFERLNAARHRRKQQAPR